MRSFVTRTIIGALALLLLSSGAALAASRWIYVGSNEGVDYYVDRHTICTTVSGDLSMYIRCDVGTNVVVDRLVIDIENRNYCWPDSADPSWRGIAPDSLLEQIWAVAYRAKYRS